MQGFAGLMKNADPGGRDLCIPLLIWEQEKDQLVSIPNSANYGFVGADVCI